MSITTFGQSHHEPRTYDIVQVKIRNKNGGTPICISATVVPKICESVKNYNDTSWFKKNYQCFKNLEFADSESDGKLRNSSIQLLVGSDFYWAFIKNDIVRSKYGPVALKSTLGWILSGPVDDKIDLIKPEGSTSLFVNSFENEVEKMKKFWQTESLGICENEEGFLENFESKIKFNGNRYSVPLPFKKFDNEIICNNKPLAKKRLNAMLNRFQNKPNLFKAYNDIIDQQKNEGIIEEVDQAHPNEGYYYMPHHGIERPDRSTTKLRVVFDASSKMYGKSLNQVLHSGPNLLTPLFEILLNFRRHIVAITADIKQAFLQIEIDKKHRDFLRFLWFKEENGEKREISYRFTRAVFGVSSSPFLLNASIKFHLKQYQNEIAKKVAKSLYVDDLTTGSKNEEEGWHLYEKSNKMLKEGGFELRKWESNSTKLSTKINSAEKTQNEPVTNQKILEDTRSYTETVSNNATIVDGETKVLGLVWDKKKDEIFFRLDDLLQNGRKNKCTKRNILAKIAGIYDPLGFLSPIIIKLKVIFQKICEGKGGWDDNVDKNIKNEWLDWIEEAKNVEIRLIRCYFPTLKIDSIQLHCFLTRQKKHLPRSCI